MGQWWSSQWGIATSGNVINSITSPIKSRHIPYGCIGLLLNTIPSRLRRIFNNRPQAILKLDLSIVGVT